jgi:tripartite-type tricarboxylate transporter receptor subunit TctC
LLNVLATVAERDAGFKSLKDTWADTTTPHGQLMLTVLGGLGVASPLLEADADLNPWSHPNFGLAYRSGVDQTRRTDRLHAATGGRPVVQHEAARVHHAARRRGNCVATPNDARTQIGQNTMFELRTCDWLRLSVLACALLAVTQTAAAQSFPSRPLTLVVPFAAGGPSDVAGRVVAQGLSDKLGQQVVVENPAGAGGTLGSLRVAKALPDGYQFVIGNIGTHAWSQGLYKKPPYNTVTDFAALGLVVEAPRAIITPKSFPANTLSELIAYVKANQNRVKYGSASAGSASHVSCILLNAALGINIVHIPYRGLGPAMQDLIAGRIDYMCDSPSTSRPQIETNNVKAIATTDAKRTSVFPEVPTAREQGIDFEVTAWQGLFLPKDTPDPIVRHLNQALSAALDLPFVRERFKAIRRAGHR